MNELLDDRRLNAWRALLKAQSAVVALIEQELAAAGTVSFIEYDVLVALVDVPGRRLRLRDLTRRLVLTRSGITRLVDRLEVEGLLRRERTESDRRGVQAVLTDRGFEAVRSAWPIYARGIRRHFGCHLTDQEAEVLTTILSRISAASRSTGQD